MRSYPTDSVQAVSRLLALTVIADGGGSPLEIAATYRLKILEHADIREEIFDQVLHDLGTDLPRTHDGLAMVEKEMIDQALAEILLPHLRLRVWKAMWELSYADETLADGELALLLLATSTWGIERAADGGGRIAGPAAPPDFRG